MAVVWQLGVQYIQGYLVHASRRGGAQVVSPPRRAGRRRCVASALASVALCALAACSANDPAARHAPAADQGGPLAGRCAGADARAWTRAACAAGSLDIHRRAGRSTSLDDLFEGLTRLDQRGEPVPGVASSWETSADGRTWTFHLREARWSNGAPVRAADFVYCLAPHGRSSHGLGLRAGARAGRATRMAISEGHAAGQRARHFRAR